MATGKIPSRSAARRSFGGDLVIESCSLRPRAVVRFQAAYFVGPEIRRQSGEIVINVGQSNTGVHRRRTWTQPEVEI
jgi:hypothetical protein